MKTPPTPDDLAREASPGRGFLQALRSRLPLFTLLASIVVREYAGICEEIGRINVGEPGYQADLEIKAGPPIDPQA